MAASPINDLEIVNEVKLLTVGEHLEAVFLVPPLSWRIVNEEGEEEEEMEAKMEGMEGAVQCETKMVETSACPIC